MELDKNGGWENLPPKGKVLYAFDFDHTILQGNSDTEITSLVEEPLPPEVKAFHKGAESWTLYMNKVLLFLHSKGVGLQDLGNCVKNMQPAPGMVPFLQEIQGRSKTEQELLIISDANDYFITSFLQPIGVEADGVITNKSFVTEQGQLQLGPYHDQTECAICPRRLCKGAALQEYVKTAKKKGLPFSHVVYVGDGRNDACPGMRLSPQDFLFVRKGFGLEKIVEKKKVKVGAVEVEVNIKARTYLWEHAHTIRDIIFPNLHN